MKFARDARAVRAATDPWAQADFGLADADELTVYGSELTRHGPVYTPLARARLGG